ncbi:DNA-binding transcriptional LysR family regulator [Silvimonas terrae]|uniref:DNA-binding transcriptional LysR family regulator n=1 Tax=Silvimonas terrae TaxID=300266 RepID=A0A840RB11_9NEIS|nr:LysR family transcriptional regulator [Silvimonas terrae]MBB5189530.1 DNA-binding transcriptional LysR family regulator [Silvimonas terrae]
MNNQQMKTSTEELLAFVTVVDTGSITGAAQQLDQTTSGISRALTRLEQKLSTTLLNRTTRRLELTEEGRLFLANARKIIAAIDDAEEELAVRREHPAGRLRVNGAFPFILHVIVPLVAEFRERYPGIALELNASDTIIDLLEQRTDIAIRHGQLQDSSLHARFMGHSRLRVLAAPGYLAQRGMPEDVTALAQHALIGFSQPESLNNWPLRHADGDGYIINPALVCSSGESVLQLAEHGNGIACLSDFMTAKARASGRLVEVLPQASMATYQPIHAVYYRNTGLSARIRCFLDFLGEKLPGLL